MTNDFSKRTLKSLHQIKNILRPKEYGAPNPMVDIAHRASRKNWSADRDAASGYHLSPLLGIVWMARSLFNNLLPTRPRKAASIQMLDFIPRDGSISDAERTSSPGRIALDRFLEEFPWEKLTQSLGPLSVVDFGCGNGSYTTKLENLLGRNLLSAVGLDIVSHPDWESRQSNRVRFECVMKDRLDLPEHNVLLTVTSLEHVEHDVGLIQAFHTYSSATDKRYLQVHIVPAPRSLWLYLTHGYRQYSIATIRKLFDGTNEDGKLEIVRIGGSAMARVHKKWIRSSLFLRTNQRRFSNPAGYVEALVSALNDDRHRKRQNSPIYYGIISGPSDLVSLVRQGFTT